MNNIPYPNPLPKGEGISESPHPNPLPKGEGISDKNPRCVHRGLNNVVLEAKNFSISLGGKEILREVSFSVCRGEYVAIVGPNGAGKTTLLKCFDRLLTGGTGELEIEGMEHNRFRQKDLARLVAYVPQADSRMIPFSVEQFLLMCRYPHLSPFSPAGKKDRLAVSEAMSRTNTAEFAGRRISTLSGGERQKVYIAAALAQGRISGCWTSRRRFWIITGKTKFWP